MIDDSVRLSVDTRFFDWAQQKLAHIPLGFQIAAQAALSKTLDSGRSLGVRRVMERLLLPRQSISRVFTVKKPSFRTLSGILAINGKPSWLSEFVQSPAERSVLLKRSRQGGSNKRGPIWLRIWADRQTPIRKGFAGAFGNKRYPFGIFRRTGVHKLMARGRYKGTVREAIERARGPRIISMFTTEGGSRSELMREIVQSMEFKFRNNMRSQVSRVLGVRRGDPTFSRLQARAMRAIERENG